MLRCTAKILALLRVAEPVVGDARGDDWYAHLIWIDRRKCFLCTHARTLFSVFVADVKAAELRPIGPFVTSAIEAALRAEGLPPGALGDHTAGDVVVGKTVDRGVVGTMNDLTITAEHLIAARGGLAHCDTDTINHGLHRTINSIIGYTRPIDLIATSENSQSVM